MRSNALTYKGLAVYKARKKHGIEFFDVNAVGGDDHLQFLNWTDVNNGAYDYAADTRGYTYDVMLEYADRAWAVRFAEALMPKVANGIHLDADISLSTDPVITFGFVPHAKGQMKVVAQDSTNATFAHSFDVPGTPPG